MDVPIVQAATLPCRPAILDAQSTSLYAQHLPTIHVSGTPSPYPTPAPSPGPNVFQPQPQVQVLHPSFEPNSHPGFASSMLLHASHSSTPTPPLYTASYGSNPIPQPQAQKRPRVTMGPRADCEKCRLGVKGHWMHFD